MKKEFRDNPLRFAIAYLRRTWPLKIAEAVEENIPRELRVAAFEQALDDFLVSVL